MRIIYMGTPQFAVAPLKRLIESDKHQVVAVVTQPDKPVGRKGIITPPPVKVEALANDIPVYQFDRIRVDGVEVLKSIDADIMVTCAYGQILSQEIIDICKFGIVNIHASLLPAYRGAAPIQYAVVRGEKKTGVTFMQTQVGLDSGDIIASFECEIGEDETAGELAERLSVIGADNVSSVLSDIEKGKAKYVPQDETKAFTVKTVKKEDARIDFDHSAIDIKRLIQGMNPSPVAYTSLNGKKIKIFTAQVADGEYTAKNGEVVKASGELLVKTSDGILRVIELQEEGGKKMNARDYLLGRKIKVGDVLGEIDA